MQKFFWKIGNDSQILQQVIIKKETMTNRISTTSFVGENGLWVSNMQLMETDEVAVEVATIEASEEEEDLFRVLKIQAAKKKEEDDDDDEDDDVEDDVEDDEKDEWDEVEEEDDWDPDFDEFDIPKSTKKGAGKKEDEEEDVKFDDDLSEFDDLFGEGGDDFDDDDDF
jgi:DNA-directed RNA polymerase subunit delta